jgi:hypothetical protein
MKLPAVDAPAAPAVLPLVPVADGAALPLFRQPVTVTVRAPAWSRDPAGGV